MSQDTIFTKIIKREVPAHIRYEDEDFIAFDDIHPSAPIHILIVPKKQIPTLEDIDEDDHDFHAKLLHVARVVARKAGIQEEYRLEMNIGSSIQQVQHIHLHLLGGWKDQA